MLAQDLLVVMGTVLAAAIAVEDAAFGWRSESDGHFHGPDCKVTLHAIADSPTNDTPGMQIEDDGQIQPALAGPDIADVARPFLVRLICFEVAIQQVRGDVEGMIAVCGRLELARSFNGDPVLAHQATHPAVPHIDANFLQLFGHSGPAVAAQAQTRLFLDVGQDDHISTLPAAGRTAAERPQSARADVHDLT